MQIVKFYVLSNPLLLLYVFNEERSGLITGLYQLKLQYVKISFRKTFCASCGLQMVIVKGEVFQVREKGELFILQN